jgi:hypothetical protein
MKKTLIFVGMLFAAISVPSVIAADKPTISAEKKEKKAKKAKGKTTEVTGVISVKGKKITLTTEDGTAYAVKEKKKLEEIKALDGKTVTLSGTVADAKKGDGKEIKGVKSVTEAAAE